MRILWIEDNPNEHTRHNLTSGLNNCDLVEAKDYNTAYKKITTELEHYDLIILDINLENSEFSGQAKEDADSFQLIKEDFWKEAGFHLFIQLLELGFPKNRIVFVTGNVSETDLQRAVIELQDAVKTSNNAQIEILLNERIPKALSDSENAAIENLAAQGEIENLLIYLDAKANAGSNNTYNQFKQCFRNARIQPPRAIRKGGNYELTDIQTWGKEHVENAYLRLRRGIIDGCNHLATATTDSELQEYFLGLKRYLPLIEPKSAARNSEYLHLARAIVHDWDNNGHAMPDRTVNPMGYNLSWILRTARNWLAHDSLLTVSDEKIIAFLFLINARLLVPLTESKLETFEQELLALFTINDDTETKITINLKNFYKEISTICEQKSIEFIGRYYSQIVNNFHEKKVTDCNYYTLLFRCFMFTVYRQHFSYPKANTNNSVSPYLDYQVKFAKPENLPLYLQEFTTRFYPLAI